MPFELESMTKVRVLDVRTLAAKDRKPDDQPGAQLLLQATLGAGVLAMFDGFLPGLLYRKPQAKKQTDLDGIESAELTSVGEHVKRLPWVYEQTGNTIEIDYGRGGSSNIVLGDVKVHRVSMRPEQTGVVIQWTADALGLTDAVRGKLTGLKRTDIQMTMTAPEVDGDGQQSIDDAPQPAASKPAKGGAKKDAKAAGESKEPQRGESWPFPQGSPEAALAGAAAS